MKLRELPIGSRGVVVGYTTADMGYRQKLLRMGLVRGAEFVVVRCAPLGDPIELEVRGYKLMLRVNEADALDIEALVSHPPERARRRRWRLGWKMRRRGACSE